MKSEDEDMVQGSPLSWYDKRKAFVLVVFLVQKCLVGLFRGSCQVFSQTAGSEKGLLSILVSGGLA